MSIEVVEIRVSGLTVQILRKDIKNLHLGVYPPHGRVRVAAPLQVSNDAVRLAVIRKLGWIKRQQARFKAQARQSDREMVSGESHYFLGQRYRLRVVNHDLAAKVLVRNKATIELHVRRETSTEQRERVLQRWYRQQLRKLIPPLLEKWQHALCVQVADWGIRKMKTRWGTCNAKACRIWLNLELAKKPPQCLEYIILHELVHLVVKHHDDRFIAMLDEYLPQRRLHRQELNAAPLAHETWLY
jgi:hypothetical protein